MEQSVFLCSERSPHYYPQGFSCGFSDLFCDNRDSSRVPWAEQSECDDNSRFS